MGIRNRVLGMENYRMSSFAALRRTITALKKTIEKNQE